MHKKNLSALVGLSVLGAAAWLGAPSARERTTAGWQEVVPGVLRSPGWPAGYALVAGDRALVVNAPTGPEGLKARGVARIDAVLLTHHHRDTASRAGQYLKAGVPVRAAKESAEWLTPEGVRKYWQESLPLRNSRTAYLVLPEGPAGIDCSLTDGQTMDWNGWSIEVLATPGAARGHVAFAARRGKGGLLLVFCGDALAEPGKLWAPYTTDWDHWTDAGLKPAAASLLKLARLRPDMLLPAHGDVVRADAEGVLTRTAAAVREMGFLKSFERYTKERLKDPPSYRFLVKEQAESNGSRPWSRVSEHLFLTGNTYVLVSRDNAAYLVVDPWDPHSARQLPLLKADRKLGDLEVVLFSHAHYDHYDGIYSLLGRDGKAQTWTLDRVAGPLADPNLLRAPFLDPRPVKFDRLPRDGETLAWREYNLRFHHLPGQTDFTMGVETVIDGKRCYFTADNFFHQDQFSGTGGWMGLNRSWPLPYAASARKVLEAAPEWVLAEHGGPFEFNAEDFRRRVRWGEDSARAADALCVSGNHRQDWDPHRLHVEPLLHKARPGVTLKASLVAGTALAKKGKLVVTLEGRGLTPDQTWDLEVTPETPTRREIALRVDEGIPAGRHVFALRAREGDRVDGSDAFVAVDVGP